ncbi:MAG: ABC transporter ATP-binding protein [Acidimicrobiia bacterium]
MTGGHGRLAASLDGSLAWGGCPLHYVALRRLAPYVRPHVGQLAGITASALVGLVAGALIPLVAKAVVDGPVADGRRAGIVALAALALGFGLVESAMACLRRFVLTRASLGLETSLRDAVYAHLQRLPVSFHDGWQSGQLLSRATSDIAAVRRFVGFGLVFLVVNSATFCVVVVLLVRLSPALAAVTAASLVPVAVLSGRFHRRYLDVSRRVQDQTGDLATLVEESATGIRVVKAYGAGPATGARYRAAAAELRDSEVARVDLLGRFIAHVDLVPELTLAFVVLGGAVAVGQGTLTIGGLVAFVSLLLLLQWPVSALGFILASAEEAESAARRVFEILDTVPAVADRPGARRRDRRADGAVRFEAVRFAFPGAANEILRGVDLDLAPGERVGLVGMSGSGKTVLTHLVPRLYDPTGGRVLLDGVDVAEVTLAALRAQVGFAFEEPVLFSMSVAENLRLGAPRATGEDMAAALAVCRAGFVHDLPHGLETRVGEQGLTLSGGQRQRLALARAVLGRPPVLVLDDPLSALDVHTEAAVVGALRRALSGTTTLVVSHRPSTLALVDRVALLHDGVIAATGRHADLLDGVPEYRALLSDLGPLPAATSHKARSQ